MDDALKKEAASEAKSDTFSSIMKVCVCLGCTNVHVCVVYAHAYDVMCM